MKKKLILCIFFSFSVLFNNVYTKNTEQSLDMQLINAIHSKNLTKIKKLIKKGARTNWSVEKIDPSILNPPIIEAVDSGSPEILKYLLTHSNFIVDEKNTYGQTPLTLAIEWDERGNFEMAKILLEHGANVNEQNGKGHTPLMYSAKFAHTEPGIKIAKLLLEHGADVNLKDNKGNTALMIAEKNKNKKMINLLKNMNKSKE